MEIPGRIKRSSLIVISVSCYKGFMCVCSFKAERPANVLCNYVIWFEGNPPPQHLGSAQLLNGGVNFDV